MNKKYKPNYYGVDNKTGKAFWKPNKAIREQFGYKSSYPLGPDGPAARAKAELYNAELERKRKQRHVPMMIGSKYDPDTLGDIVERFKKTNDWSNKKVRTKEGIERGWKYIEPAFGNKLAGEIKFEDIDEFYRWLENNKGSDARWRTIKILNQILNWAITFGIITTNPAYAIRNPGPNPRDETWLLHELQALSKRAWEMEYHSISIAIDIATVSGMSPIDIFMLSRSQRYSDDEGQWFYFQRKKTEVSGLAILLPNVVIKLNDYMQTQGVPLMDTDPILRQPNGTVYLMKNEDDEWAMKKVFNEHFRNVRKDVFPGDKRQFRDIRRSVSTAAYEGGASPDDVGFISANGTGTSSVLQNTYIKKEIGRSRALVDKVLAGHEIIQNGNKVEIDRTPESKKSKSKF